MALPFFETPKEIDNRYRADAEIILYSGDAKGFIATIPDKTVSLVVTSPPYNLGKEYENRVSIGRYLDMQAQTLAELYRILRPDGSLCWQVGNFVEDGEVYPLDTLYYPIFKKLNFYLRNRIVWYFGHGLHASKRFSGRYETLLWFTKSSQYTFNLDDVRVPAKYPGKRHFKGPRKGELSGNPLGKNPSDVWEFLTEEWETALWDIPNVKSNHPEKTEHPCQYPIALIERCVLALTNEGDWVFDPYMGVGTSLLAGLMHQRRVMGSEKEAAYVAIARERIESFFRGTLKYRPLGKPVYVPTGREKVSQMPEEWKAAAQNRLLEQEESYE
ncbi:MAG TPA: site-specific DNA-methyltransferase [Anaerolineae bacterium]|nr:site-specific DNA-methyltransferase [Anaerolineae bacterium]